MHFDSTVSLGNLVTLAVFVLTLFKLHTDNIRLMTRMETKLDMMWKWFQNNMVIKSKHQGEEE